MDKPSYLWKPKPLRPKDLKIQLTSEPITAAEKASTNAITSTSMTRAFNGAIRHNEAMVRTGFIPGSKTHVKLFDVKTGANKPDKRLQTHASGAIPEMLVKFIVTQGAEVALHCGNDKWCKVLHWAVETKDREMLMFALKGGANIEQKDWFGETALHIAAFKGDIDVVTILLERGADVNSEDSSGSKPLHYAIVHWESKPQKEIRNAGGDDNPKVIWLLLEQGKNAGFVGAGETPLLHFAVKYNHQALTMALLQDGKDINRQDDRGHTALHVAAMESQKDTVLYLLEHGADGTIKDEDGFAYNEEEDPKVLAKALKDLQDSVSGIDVEDRSGVWVDFDTDDEIMDTFSPAFNHAVPPSEDSLEHDSMSIDEEDMDSLVNNYQNEDLENLDPSILAQQLADQETMEDEEDDGEEGEEGDGDGYDEEGEEGAVVGQDMEDVESMNDAYEDESDVDL